MNCFENWFCASALWRRITERHILPWVLADYDLGEHILEIGAGSGAATEALRRRARVTSLEYDARSVSKLSARIKCSCGNVVRGDASALPFANQIFSSAIAILMLLIFAPSNCRTAHSRKFFACCGWAACFWRWRSPIVGFTALGMSGARSCR
jgi:SAM-dependent methyltransferase